MSFERTPTSIDAATSKREKHKVWRTGGQWSEHLEWAGPSRKLESGSPRGFAANWRFFVWWERRACFLLVGGTNHARVRWSALFR
jgi:hypothetical protein